MSVLAQKTVEINGHTYVLTAIPAKDAWPLALRVKEAKDRAAMALVSMGSTDALTPLGVALASQAALSAASASWSKTLQDPNLHRDLVCKIWSLATRDGLGFMPQPNMVPEGIPLDELYQVVEAGVDFNFGPFCEAFGKETMDGANALAMMFAAAAQPSKTTKTGRSG